MNNQSSDAVNQCGKDLVAMALEALEDARNRLHDYSCRTYDIDEAIAALSSIKDQQAQPVEQHPDQRNNNQTLKDIRPLLYTETVNDRQVCRDDLWIITTEYMTKLSAPVDQQEHGAMPVSSIDYQQQRGVHADIIDEALASYDQWYADDDYNAQAAMDRIMTKMRERAELYAAPHAPASLPEVSAWPIRGVRVDGDKVIVMAKGGNDAARWLCGALITAMHEAPAQEKKQPTTAGKAAIGGRPTPLECCKFVSVQVRRFFHTVYADRIDELIREYEAFLSKHATRASESAEQQARDMLERIGVDNAQSFSSGDLVELANLIAASKPEEQEPAAPHIVEALSWHANERDDLSLDEAIDYIRQGWKKVRGRTEATK